MAKAINWPLAYRNEVIDEAIGETKCALRPGRLYFDNRYWVDGERVLIRVNYKIIRTALIVGDLKCCAIKDLTPDDYAKLKRSLNSVESVMAFLTEAYGHPVTPDSEVTVVYYQNEAIDPEKLEREDDPHMEGEAAKSL